MFSPCCPIHPVCQFQIIFFFPANCCWFFIFCLSLSHCIRWSCGWSLSFYPPVKSSGWCYLRAAWRCFSLPDSYCQHEFNQVLFETCLFLVTLFLHLKPVCLIPPEGFYWHYQPTSVLLRKGKYLPVTHLSAHSLLLTLCLPANNSSEFQSMSKVSDSISSIARLFHTHFGHSILFSLAELPVVFLLRDLFAEPLALFQLTRRFFSIKTVNLPVIYWVCFFSPFWYYQHVLFFPFLLVSLFVVLGSSSQTFCALQYCDILADLSLC